MTTMVFIGFHWCCQSNTKQISTTIIIVINVCCSQDEGQKTQEKDIRRSEVKRGREKIEVTRRTLKVKLTLSLQSSLSFSSLSFSLNPVLQSPEHPNSN